MSPLRPVLLAHCVTALCALFVASSPLAAQSTFSDGTPRDAGVVTKANVTGADMTGIP